MIYIIPDFFFTGIRLKSLWLYFHDAYCPNHMSKETSLFMILPSWRYVCNFSSFVSLVASILVECVVSPITWRVLGVFV